MGFNKETFKSIAPTFYLSCYEKDPEDRIYTRVLGFHGTNITMIMQLLNL